MTLAHACGRIENFTAGHETRAGIYGPRRLAYPRNHIEVDNRLAWHLGLLGQAYDGEQVKFVHLLRDPDAVAASYARRWDAGHQRTIVKGFAEYLVLDWGEAAAAPGVIARHMVDVITANIRDFLRWREHVTVEIEDPASFARMLEWIGAEGDLEAAVEAFRQVKNKGE